MARNDGVDRTVARNRDLKTHASVDSAQAHNERQKEIYSNPDIVPERTLLNVHFKEPAGSYEEVFADLEQQKVISTWGLKPGSTRLCELVFDVNSAYFFNHGGYEFARRFYADAYDAAVKIVGGEQYILSAVMHADERNCAMSDALGRDVYHYHMHVVYVPVVEKQILWTKRCKDPSLVGTVKETVMQVSRSKKWDSRQKLDDSGNPMFTANGKPVMQKSYSVLQDDFHQHMIAVGYTDVERGERGSTEEHLSVTQFKVEQEKQRLAELAEKEEQAKEQLFRLEKQEDRAQTRVDHIVPKMKALEEQARKYAGDVDDRLPQPDILESAKAYRENKAKPALRKLQKIYMAVYDAFLDLKRSCDSLKKDLARALKKISALETTVDRMTHETAELTEAADKYDTLCRGLGKDTVEDRVREIREKELREKQQKKTRNMTRDAR
jgi:hypothetical protein